MPLLRAMMFTRTRSSKQRKFELDLLKRKCIYMSQEIESLSHTMLKMLSLVNCGLRMRAKICIS